MNKAWEQDRRPGSASLAAESNDSAAQIAIEVAYLRQILLAQAVGRRVAVIGYGIERHAIRLAEAGFTVTALDASPAASNSAVTHDASAGIATRRAAIDPFSSQRWPSLQVDAVFVRPFGWGTDTDQRRILRRVRALLAPDGVLILDHPNLIRVLEELRHEAASPSEGNEDPYSGRFDVLTGRCTDYPSCLGSGSSDEYAPGDLRLYTAVELATLVREAGFAVTRFDADFTPGQAVAAGAHRLQLVARPLPSPPRALAVTFWRTPSEYLLDLRYAPDEPAWLDISPNEIWAEALTGDGAVGAVAAGSYPVDDPYGAERGAPVLARHFGIPVSELQATFGAGVTSLLRDLSKLADSGLILTPRTVHPDLAVWAIAAGATVRHLDGPLTVDRFVAAIASSRPALVHLDRPAVTGECLSLPELQEVGETAAAAGATVVVDESAASYLGPGGSAGPLIHHLDNLVVLRGMTKGYSWGGLRVGYALASEGTAGRIRELVAPLQVSEPSLRAVLRILAAGDIFHRLRARIAVNKPIVVDLLRTLGLRASPGHRALPWVLVADPVATASSKLIHRGIRGQRPARSPVPHGDEPEVLQLFIPLSEERLNLFRQLLTAPSDTTGRI